MKKSMFIFAVLALILVVVPTYVSAQTAGETEHGILPTYSILPSFRYTLDYNLIETYENITKFVKLINDECSDKEDTSAEKALTNCVNEKSKPNIQTFCLESNEVLAFYKLTNVFKMCIASKGDECSCDLKNSLDSILKDLGSYTISIKQDSEKIIFTLNNRKNEMIKREELNGKLTIYEGKTTPGPFINIFDWKKTEPFKFDKTKGINYDLVKINGLFVYPTQFTGMISPPIREDITKFDNFNKQCKMKDQYRRAFKFCIAGNNQFNIYDKEAGWSLKSISTRFAAFVKDNSPPLKVENLEATPKDKSKNNVLVSWDESKSTDVEKYVINYEGKTHDLDREVFGEIYEYDSTPKCQLDLDGQTCKFVFTLKEKDGTEKVFSSAAGEAFFTTKDSKYHYILNAEKSGSTVFSVNAVDDFANEGEKSDSKTIEVSDKLAPGIVKNLKCGDGKVSWTAPTTNIDGTELNSGETILYKAYFSKDNFDKTSIPTKATLKVISPLASEKGYYAIVAYDENGNSAENDILNTINCP